MKFYIDSKPDPTVLSRDLPCDPCYGFFPGKEIFDHEGPVAGHGLEEMQILECRLFLGYHYGNFERAGQVGSKTIGLYGSRHGLLISGVNQQPAQPHSSYQLGYLAQGKIHHFQRHLAVGKHLNKARFFMDNNILGQCPVLFLNTGKRPPAQRRETKTY